MKRVSLSLLFVTASLVVGGCAQDSAELGSSVAAVGATTTAVIVADQTTLADRNGDFGSKYLGSPVAFWFWAPY